jgi:hypothetical protein
MNPNKFKPKQKDFSKTARGKVALERLKARWRLDSEDGEWEPESEPIVTPMLKAVPGGITFCIEALRAHDEDDSRQFLETWDACTRTDRALLRIEDIAHASGIGSLRLAEIAQTALFLYGDRQAQMILSASMPKVIRSTVKAATDEVPITATSIVDGEFITKVVGKTNGDTRAMEMLLKSRGILPIPKGSQIAIQVNNPDREDKQPESGHEWKYPEDRLKEITAITNPKQLEASTSQTSEHIHFDTRRPVVFER